MNTFNKYITKISVVLAIAFAFTSCQDPILYNINQEVKLESASILGDIFTIVRYGDPNTGKLFVANGNIYSKDISNTSHGAWTKMPSPPGHIHSLAADGSTLYAFSWGYDRLTGNGETHLEDKRIYYSTNGGATWTEHPISSSATSPISHSSHGQPIVLMCTNAPKTAHREAYLRVDNNIYKLTGTTYNSSPSKTGEYNSCVYFGSVVFYKSFGSCTNETASADASAIYYGDGYYVYKSTNGSTGTRISDAVRGYITSLAVTKAAENDGNNTKDRILIGSRGGSALIDTKGNEIEFRNLTSTVSNLYEVHAVLAAFPDRVFTADNAIFYASNQVYGTGSNSAQFSHEGLWSYYGTRGKWNIE